ncbi:MAG: IS1380 family transposase [Mycobacterium sp.]|uniref:IS1380 family transposase n=1 Tax=Mycobacterium sp. TaxID=1785 RepID=UPI0026119E42|nr:IS1380 family transposase [Mycobacterium sp.]MDI3313933.1 IS1380 family transposase [Mycobacterium sp.]MDI3314514.1 IS1380 family transposase [Mycobacterium sp.]
MKTTAGRPGLVVTTGGRGVVAHAGTRLLCELADGLGLTEGLSAAMAPTKKRRRGHDRGRVLTDLAVAIGDGATAISDLRVLADQPDLFGQVASVATAWRTLEAVDTDALARIQTARAAARAAAWATGADPGWYVIDIDGVLIEADSDKHYAAPTYKRGFGFYPLLAVLDATGEALAGLLRPGNAGSGTAGDHLSVLEAALAQLPVDPAHQQVICRTDAGGTSHELAAACRSRGVRFIGGVPMPAARAEVILALPRSRWQSTISADASEVRDTGEVAEITDLVSLSGWPPGTRMLVRREQPHPGAQLRFTDLDGYRYQLFVTDLPDADLAYLEALYRGRGRMECAIRDLKDTGLANLPSHDFAITNAWLMVVLIAADLLAWTKTLCLDGALASAEPKRLRYTLLHTAGVLVRSARRTTLRLGANWPWAIDLLTAFTRLPGWVAVPG